MSKRKIDTHQHFLPKLYVDAVGLDLLNAAMPGGKAPTWSVEAAIAMMDENGIDEGILSISSGPTLPDAATLLRKCNDHAAELRSRHTGRFGSFASLPLPDVDAALKEVRYCLDDLKVDGFIAFTNYNGLYLGRRPFHTAVGRTGQARDRGFHSPQPATSRSAAGGAGVRARVSVRDDPYSHELDHVGCNESFQEHSLHPLACRRDVAVSRTSHRSFDFHDACGGRARG